MKKIRKDDPLLSYLHHARNSDEHGIEEHRHEYRRDQLLERQPQTMLARRVNLHCAFE